MKNLIIRILVPLMLTLFVCIGAPCALATEDTGVDYDDLFARAFISDGFESERIAIELADCYDQDPGLFVSKLSVQEERIIDSVLGLLVGEYNCFRDIQALTDYMDSVLTDPEKTELERAVAQSVFEWIEFINHPVEEDPNLPQYAPTYKAFNPDVVRPIIDSFLEINSVSESFFSYVSKMYRLDPVLFADMISDMPEDRIKHIGICIAADLLKHGISDPVIDSTDASTTLILLALTISNTTDIDDALAHSPITPPKNEDSTTANSPMPPAIVGIDIGFDALDDPQAQVGEYVYLDTIIEYTASPSTLFVFYVELYEVVDSQSVYIDGSTLAVPPGSTQATYSFRQSFAGAGNKSFLVKIYNQSKTDLLNSREFLKIFEIHSSESKTPEILLFP